LNPLHCSQQKATKILKENGHEVVTFEKSSKIGGIWSVCYPGASLQNSKAEYYFPDFPPKYTSYHPTAEEVREYINVRNQ
jgi:cation diffusion facilitator CzcD-associated flavoprotein CzcO